MTSVSYIVPTQEGIWHITSHPYIREAVHIVYMTGLQVTQTVVK